VVNPLMPIFRERELAYMLGFAGRRCWSCPRSSAASTMRPWPAGLQRELPELRHVIVVDGDGDDGFERVLLSGSRRVEPAQPPRLAPDAMAVVMFTSGTTGSPKGVMHSHNTLLACNRALAGRFGLTGDDVLLACSPLGHMTGYAAIMLLGFSLGRTVVLQDVWEGRRGVTIMADEGVTFTAASTPFLSDICEAVRAGAPRPAALRNFLCGGAPIPPVLIERAARELGPDGLFAVGHDRIAVQHAHRARACRREVGAKTDGRPLEGVEIRIVDFGPASRFRRADRPPAGARRADADGLLQAARHRDLRRRGLVRHRRPGLCRRRGLHPHQRPHQGRADPRRRERAGGRDRGLALQAPGGGGRRAGRLPRRAAGRARLRLRRAAPGGTSFTLEALQAYMADSKVAKQYWPERVEIVDDLPRTPSGKVQKFKLRERR
jgi:cyclohexanecarboxylate-CoA ligase